MMRGAGLDLDGAVAACGATNFLMAGSVLDPAADGQGG
jgi:hypothetical protein